MANEFDRALSVISKPPGRRLDEETRHLVPWLRSKAKLFKTIKADMMADIIRNCHYMVKERDEVIIQQGDVGDCFYVTLSGQVSIYIYNKDQAASTDVADHEDERPDILNNMLHYKEDGSLDRARLGNFVLSLGAGSPFGDVALTSGDSIRTASIIADTRTDLLVVDRDLYNRSVKEVLAKEFQEKTHFIQNNPLFSTWPAKYRKQLAMALYKESFGYESRLTRQGDRTSDMYFVLSGQVEIQLDNCHHKQQYPQFFKTANGNGIHSVLIGKPERPSRHKEKVSPRRGSLPGSVKERSGSNKRNGAPSKCVRLCHLGVNESVGDTELTMSLPTYMQTAVCRETTEVLVLEGKHFDRLFVRRHPRTIEAMKDQIGIKLQSRLGRIRHKVTIPFLEILQSRIAGRSKPPPQSEVREQPSVSEAEKEFLKHKGPLIDQHGPGSVFYLIKLRELTKMRVAATRNDRLDRMAMDGPNRRNIPSSVLLAAANQMRSLSEDPNARMRPVSSIGGYNPARAAAYKMMQNAFRRHEEEEENRVEDGEDGEDAVNRLREEFDKENESDPAGIVNEEEDLIQSYRSFTSHSMEFEAPEDQDARLSILEERLRRWMQADNPKTKAHVAQLRRLPIDDMEYQPRPGNKVYVRKRDRKLESQNTLLAMEGHHPVYNFTAFNNSNSNGTATKYSNFSCHNINNSGGDIDKKAHSTHNTPRQSLSKTRSLQISPRMSKSRGVTSIGALLS